MARVTGSMREILEVTGKTLAGEEPLASLCSHGWRVSVVPVVAQRLRLCPSPGADGHCLESSPRKRGPLEGTRDSTDLWGIHGAVDGKSLPRYILGLRTWCI